MSKNYGKCESCLKRTYSFIETIYGKMWLCKKHKSNNAERRQDE